MRLCSRFMFATEAIFDPVFTASSHSPIALDLPCNHGRLREVGCEMGVSWVVFTAHGAMDGKFFFSNDGESTFFVWWLFAKMMFWVSICDAQIASQYTARLLRAVCGDRHGCLGGRILQESLTSMFLGQLVVSSRPAKRGYRGPGLYRQ